MKRTDISALEQINLRWERLHMNNRLFSKLLLSALLAAALVLVGATAEHDRLWDENLPHPQSASNALPRPAALSVSLDAIVNRTAGRPRRVDGWPWATKNQSNYSIQYPPYLDVESPPNSNILWFYNIRPSQYAHGGFQPPGAILITVSSSPRREAALDDVAKWLVQDPVAISQSGIVSVSPVSLNSGLKAVRVEQVSSAYDPGFPSHSDIGYLIYTTDIVVSIWLEYRLPLGRRTIQSDFDALVNSLSFH